MSKIWIANASPLIVLAKVGQLELLTQLSTELLLPEAVVVEILAGPASDAARQAIDRGWGRRVAPKSISNSILEWGLGLGESSVLALAEESTPATAILDDAAARTCANAMGIPVIGTLGVILRARQQKLIQSAAAVVRELQIASLYVDDDTIRTALRAIGEQWEPADD